MENIDLTTDEALLIVDALNGIIIYPELAEQLLPHEIADAIALDHLDKKWNVDGAALLEKIKVLDNAQANDLLRRVGKFWDDSYRVEEARERVKAVGLAKGN